MWAKHPNGGHPMAGDNGIRRAGKTGPSSLGVLAFVAIFLERLGAI